MSRTVGTPEEGEALKAGTIIMDAGDLYALKTTSGAWMYETGRFWEPQFPVRVVAEPED